MDAGTGDSIRLPTKANVLARLPECAVAHFACHGSSDLTDPSNSSLLLYDHDSDPFTVAGLAEVRLDQAQLAYLSACRTAFTGRADLIDEAIHLTSACQLMGFPHVIGTMWAIGDTLAANVADAFYRALSDTGGALRTTRAAEALHRTILGLRDRFPQAPSLWAAYLHAGA